MLTNDQIEQFRLALAADNNGGYEEDADLDDAYCEADEVVQTRDTVDDFTKQWGKPHDSEEYTGGTLMIWNKLQTRKGAQRGDLYVMDFGDARAAYFSGQA